MAAGVDEATGSAARGTVLRSAVHSFHASCPATISSTLMARSRRAAATACAAARIACSLSFGLRSAAAANGSISACSSTLTGHVDTENARHVDRHGGRADRGGAGRPSPADQCRQLPSTQIIAAEHDGVSEILDGVEPAARNKNDVARALMDDMHAVANESLGVSLR